MGGRSLPAGPASRYGDAPARSLRHVLRDAPGDPCGSLMEGVTGEMGIASGGVRFDCLAEAMPEEAESGRGPLIRGDRVPHSNP